MASITASAPPTPQLPSTPAQEMEKSSVHEEDSLPSDDGDEPLDVDQDDVQSIIQPALSPMATRLTSPKTPAAEKAAAMENLPGGGLFSVKEGTVADYSDQGTPTSSAIPVVRTPIPRPQAAAALQTRQNRGLSLSHLPPSFSQASRFPSPWQSGPKEFVVECQTSPKPTLSAVFGQGRHRRSFSGGPDALKRIREALPSISLPSFFSGPSSAKSASFDTKLPTQSGDGAAESKPVPSMTKSATFGSQSVNRDSAAGSMSLTGQASASSRPPSSVAFRPRAIRRSTSDESMLYHSLSRVSSLGDDDRWNSTREQKNSRLKAITDSWDRPSFKMPQMSQLPNILPAPLKRNSLLGSETSETTPTGAARPGVISENVSDLDRALESLTGDIVVLGGYRGSVLRSTRTNRQVWVPVKVGLNIRKVNLEVGLDPEDEQRMEETIYASGMLQNIGPVDISRRLFKRLRECDNARTGKLRVWDFGYDWRLSPHLLSQKLVSFIEKLPSNQGNGNAHERGATVIAHSLGGLITRHAVNTRPEIFKGVVYAGTPQRCINGMYKIFPLYLAKSQLYTYRISFC
ncbi:hypothetical protein F5Y15DRAFT_366113 [Xylariaceae sp. FL0016]|nr:hypothetical protein F5Y15DRAFT_366113 [Xylariaceae sp. FL0016]